MNKIIAIALFVLATQAYGHHIRGIPHYGYKKNYPQVPVIEEKRSSANFELIFTYFKIPGSKACDLSFYIKNKKTGKPYVGTVRFKVYGAREDPEANHSFDASMTPTNTYNVIWEYEQDGVYTVLIEAPGENLQEEFRIQIGDDSKEYIYLVSLFCGLAALMVFVALIKKNRGKSAEN